MTNFKGSWQLFPRTDYLKRGGGGGGAFLRNLRVIFFYELRFSIVYFNVNAAIFYDKGCFSEDVCLGNFFPCNQPGVECNGDCCFYDLCNGEGKLKSQEATYCLQPVGSKTQLA